jgi:hypothetical protein
MPIRAIRLIRKMRGGAQSHLMECADGQFYVVKFQNNPQHRRILINEWLGSAFLSYLEIAAPPSAVVEVDAQFLEEYPETGFQLGGKHVPVRAGWQFGSLCPADPARLAIFDFLPDQLLHKVANLTDYRGALVFDKWMGNADSRQSIFFRARLKEHIHSLNEHPLKLGFVTQMIDHGYVFEGPQWNFPDSPLQGLYFRRDVYRGIRTLDDFQPWLDRVVNFPEEVIDRAWKQLPPAWVAEDQSALDNVLTRLFARRKRVPDLIRDAAKGQTRPFPDWEGK